MKKFLVTSLILFTVFFANTILAQEVVSIRGSYNLIIPEKVQKLVLDPLPAGTYSVGTGGYFPTIDSAFNKLEADGVAGNVTLELIDDLYTAPTGQYGFSLNGPIPGAGLDSRVTIKPAENKNVVVQHNGAAVFYLVNTSYVTFDGIDITGPTTLTIHALQNSSYTYNECLIFINNSDQNVVQNTIILCDDYTRPSGGIGLWKPSGTLACDSNLVQNNFIKKAGLGIYISAGGSLTSKPNHNIIRGNIIGSEQDSTIIFGIDLEECQNTIVENNIITRIKSNPNAWNTAIGILSYLGEGCIIRNNIVHNVSFNALQGSAGIFLLGLANNKGNNISVYNNMIYDIRSTSTTVNGRVSGIALDNQNFPKIYYNSIYLSGTGANQAGSAALYIISGVTNADVKNNIFVNTRDESPYCASAIYSNTNLTSDYNDLYYDDTNNNNCLVRIGGTKYYTLAEWQATTQDLNSYVEMPPFISSTNLHINDTIPTYLESRGVPITGIDTDIDGDPRNADSTDIGADEFNGIYIPTGVDDENILPTVYALEQNFPNPFNSATTIQYSIPQRSNVTLKIYDILGNEVTTLVNEEKAQGVYTINFDANNLASGLYFYRIQTGSFIDTKKMILLK